MGKSAKRARPAEASASKTSKGGVYELEVSLLEGPITDEFADANPEVSRTIEIRGNQTLADLHEAIFDAFGRFDAHMYEFQIGGEETNDPKAKRYVLSVAEEPIGGPQLAGLVEQTTIDQLGLKVDDVFGYWFDFGDDWWHQINVAGIGEPQKGARYPRVTKEVGENPPQYPQLDEDDEEYDEEDEDENDDDKQA